STPEIYTLSLHDALPIYGHREGGPGGQRALPRLRPGAPGRARERDQRRRGAHDRRPVDLGLRRDVLAGRRTVDAAPQHHGRGGRRDGLRPAHRGARLRGHGRDRVRRRRLPRDRDVPPPRGGLRRSAMLRSMLGSTVASERRPRTRAVYRELLADLETPLTAYLKVAGHPSFLLESVEQGERVARYSFIGTGERRRVSARGHDVTVTAGGETRTVTSPDPPRVLWDEGVRAAVAEPRRAGGARPALRRARARRRVRPPEAQAPDRRARRGGRRRRRGPGGGARRPGLRPPARPAAGRARRPRRPRRGLHDEHGRGLV